MPDDSNPLGPLGSLARMIFTAVVRHGLTALAGMLIAKGWLTQAQADQASTYLLSIALLIAAVGWSILQKRLVRTVVTGQPTGPVPTPAAAAEASAIVPALAIAMLTPLAIPLAAVMLLSGCAPPAPGGAPVLTPSAEQTANAVLAGFRSALQVADLGLGIADTFAAADPVKVGEAHAALTAAQATLAAAQAAVDAGATADLAQRTAAVEAAVRNVQDAVAAAKAAP